MSPIMEDAITAILRWAFAIVAGYLVEHGIWTQANATTYVAAAAIGVVSIGWSLWSKYKGRIKFLTALTMPPGSTEAQVDTVVASDSTNPSVTTPKNVAPIVGAAK